MKIVLKVLSIIQIIAGIFLVIAGLANAMDRDNLIFLTIPGALLLNSGSFLLYLLFMRSEKD